VTNHVHRLGREVRELSDGPPAEAAPLPADETDADDHQLAREAAQAFADELTRFRTAKARDKPPDPAVAPDDWDLRLIRQKAPEDFTFFDVERLARHDPAEAAARWDEVKAAARRDFDSGWLAARDLEYQGGSAWDRACFLAVRDRLRRTWQPRTDAEALLLDEIAQYELVRREWVRILSYLSRHPRTVVGYQTNGEYVPERDRRTIGAVQATAEAARMVERLQRLQQAAVRTLLGLRRTRATVTVRNTGPVNVALGPQLNVAGPPPAEPGPVVRTEASP
jgi:hypothetical protein